MVQYSIGQITTKQLGLGHPYSIVYRIKIYEQNLDSFQQISGTYLQIDSTNFREKLLPYTNCKLFITPQKDSTYEAKVICKDFPHSNGEVLNRPFSKTKDVISHGGSTFLGNISGDYNIIFDLFIKPIYHLDSVLQILIVDAPSFESNLTCPYYSKIVGFSLDSLGRQLPSNFLKINNIDSVKNNISINFTGHLSENRILESAGPNSSFNDPENTEVFVETDVSLYYSLTKKELDTLTSTIDVFAKGKINLIRRLIIEIDKDL
jgi:hypothetical protein